MNTPSLGISGRIEATPRPRVLSAWPPFTRSSAFSAPSFPITWLMLSGFWRSRSSGVACPLWPQTAQLLRTLCAERHLDLRASVPVFVNHRGEPLSRFGVRFILAKYLQGAQATIPTLAQKKLLFDLSGFGRGAPSRGYDVSADGPRFLMTRDPDAPAPPPQTRIHFVLDWFEELKRKAPATR